MTHCTPPPVPSATPSEAIWPSCLCPLLLLPAFSRRWMWAATLWLVHWKKRDFPSQDTYNVRVTWRDGGVWSFLVSQCCKITTNTHNHKSDQLKCRKMTFFINFQPSEETLSKAFPVQLSGEKTLNYVIIWSHSTIINKAKICPVYITLFESFWGCILLMMCLYMYNYTLH